MLEQEGVEGVEAAFEFGGVQGHRGLRPSEYAAQDTANREQAHAYSLSVAKEGPVA
jgi:hypothetical protein